jgi:hypothetical protein
MEVETIKMGMASVVLVDLDLARPAGRSCRLLATFVAGGS